MEDKTEFYIVEILATIGTEHVWVPFYGDEISLCVNTQHLKFESHRAAFASIRKSKFANDIWRIIKVTITRELAFN